LSGFFSTKDVLSRWLAHESFVLLQDMGEFMSGAVAFQWSMVPSLVLGYNGTSGRHQHFLLPTAVTFSCPEGQGRVWSDPLARLFGWTGQETGGRLQ